MFYLVAATEAASKGEPQTIGKLLEQGSTVLIILIALSLFLVAIVFLLYFMLRKEVMLPKAFFAEADRLTAQGDFESLATLCQNNSSASAAILGAAAEQLHSDGESSYDMIKDAAESEGSHQAGLIHHKLSYVTDISKIAPMIGLLGTVLGMMQAFSGLQSDFGAVKPVALADGIAKAMVTTAAGLIVGLAAMFCHSLLRQRASHLIDQLEARCAKTLRKFMKVGR